MNKMNKTLLVALTAALLLSAATACGKKDPDKEGDTTDTNATETTGSYIDIGTDEDGKPVTAEPGTDSNEIETLFDPTEENPTFTDVTMQVVVVSAVATVRTSTRVEDSNAVGWPSEGRLLDVSGESENWYRITYNVNGEDQTCYIAKSVAADSSVLDSFTAIEGGEEVEVKVDAVYVRSYPSTDSTHSIRGTLKIGAKATRVAVSEYWSRILYEVTSETETNEDGTPLVEIKQYYVSNDCVKVVEAATDAAQ